MKIYLSVILFLLLNCTGKSQNPPVIDFIITNDYISERNLTMMGGVMPAGYSKGLKDSLENSYVEYFEGDHIIEKKLYNSIGAIYHSEKYFYDPYKRLKKIIKTNEFSNKSCEITFEYGDNLKLFNRRTITNLCNNDVLDTYYKYNAEGEKTEFLIIENGVHYSKDEINIISKTEKSVKNLDKENRLSTFLYKYNAKDLIVYEHKKGWGYVQKPDYFQTDEQFEYLYKYDKYGNWTERTKLVFCPPLKKKAKEKKPGEVKELPPILSGSYNSCEPVLKEKLIRKIYYIK